MEYLSYPRVFRIFVERTNDMKTILLILGVIFVVAKISSPSVWSGWNPPLNRNKRYSRSEKPYGLPWIGGSMKRNSSKYYWDD